MKRLLRRTKLCIDFIRHVLWWHGGLQYFSEEQAIKYDPWGKQMKQYWNKEWNQ